MVHPDARRVADVALDLRSVANALGLRAYVKTSGRRGLHCYLPLDRRLNYSEVRVMAEMIGQFLIAVRRRQFALVARLRLVPDRQSAARGSR